MGSTQNWGQQVVISCEHGGNDIPPSLQKLFTPHQALLNSHKGWDTGALEMAFNLERSLQVPLIHQTISRLVIECNRTRHHPQLWSSITENLPPEEKEFWLDTLYYPYRNALREALVDKMKPAVPAIHISSHTMNAAVGEVERWMDIALLYDPKRSHEVALVEHWKIAIEAQAPHLKVAFNEPYQGYNDGQVVWLRGQYQQGQYLGIELELNQKYVDTEAWPSLQNTVINALQDTLASIALSDT